jgi:hypothetical protein
VRAPLLVIEVRVPTEVSELAVTPLLSVAPVTVPAAAVTVIAAVPSKSVPLMALAVAKAVAVADRPEQAAAVETVTAPPAVIVASPESANSAAIFEPLPIQSFVLASGELVGSM